jgi:hypothetical protein
VLNLLLMRIKIEAKMRIYTFLRTEGEQYKKSAATVYTKEPDSKAAEENKIAMLMRWCQHYQLHQLGGIGA